MNFSAVFCPYHEKFVSKTILDASIEQTKNTETFFRLSSIGPTEESQSFKFGMI